MSEISKLTDPNHAIEIAMGPPFPELVPQQRGSGLVIYGGQFSDKPKRFIFKKAHMERDDFRVFEADSGLVVAAMHHFGKNPYEAFGVPGTSNVANAHENRMGEWESVCDITGFRGMPYLKIRPKALSRHGRQMVSEGGGNILFNIGKESRLKEMSIRSNMAVFRGSAQDEKLYKILPDMMGRTFQVVNDKDELVCFVQKSMKALIMNAALGAGSEMLIDVAPGVDWSAMIGVVLAIQQVGSHFVKDAVGNYVVEPLKDNVVSGALQSTGLDGVAGAMGQNADQALHFVNNARGLYRMFMN